MCYSQTISEATGVTDPRLLGEIEETMRRDIFHSTLDWQTKAQLQEAAREAWALVQYLESPAGKAEYDRYLAEAMS